MSWLLRRRPTLTAAAVLAVVVAVVMASAIFGGGTLLTDDIWVSDLLNNNVPPRAFLGAQLRAGQFPLWVSGIYGGLPLLAQGEAAAMSPITWLAYGLLPWPLATTLSVAVHTWLAGLGMTLLARRLGAQHQAALVGGIGFMFCGFLVAHVKHMNLHHAACWLPWLALAADGVARRPGLRAALVLGAVGGLQITEGHPQIVYVSLYAVAALLAFRLTEPRERQRLRSLSHLARLLAAYLGSAWVALLLSAPYLVSAYELFRRSERGAHDAWTFATRFRFLPENILTLGWPYVFGDASNATYQPARGIFWESWLYVGIAPLLGVVAAVSLGLAGARAKRYRLLVATAALTALASFAFAMMRGADSRLFSALFGVLPGLSWFRFHHRFALVLTFAVVLAGSFGLSALLRLVSSRWGPRRQQQLASLLLALAAGDMTWVMRRQFPATTAADVALPPETVEVLHDHAPDEPWRMYTALGPESHVEAFYRARGWGRDLSPYLSQWRLLQPSLNLLWGVDALNGYTSMIPRDVGAVLSSHNITGSLVAARTHKHRQPRSCPAGSKAGFSGPCQHVLGCRRELAAALGAFNVRFVVSPVAMAGCSGFTLLDTVDAGMFEVRIYENQRYLPRAYWVSEALDVPSNARAALRLVDWRFDAQRQVLRTNPGVPESPNERSPARSRSAPPGARCSHHSPRPGLSRIRCEITEPGFVVVSETRYPGQELRLDGEPVEPFTANGMVLGIPVDVGHHLLELAYRPSYRHLVPLSAIGWLLLLVGPPVARRWRRRSA